ncbi:profilin [Imleria badia]|nr:profilin [Imleria badia]
MSWQDILDVGLLRSGKITQAAIVGQDGEVWAESAGCNITEAERDAIMEGFGTYPAREIFVGGRKYATMMGCLDMILAKRKDGGGCVVKKTGQSVIIAEYMGTANEMTALALVERLADYLISQGY